MKAMKTKNNKGIGLIELLVVTAVIALTTPILFWVFLYGVQSFSTYSKYMEQHYKIIDVTQRIRKDVEEAAAYKVVYKADVSPIPGSVLILWIPDDDGNDAIDEFTIKAWKLYEGSLLFKSCSGGLADGKEDLNSGFSEILDGLDTSTVTEGGSNYMLTRFEKSGNRLLLSIKPAAENIYGFKNRNVTVPIITEFSVDYKVEN